MVRDAWRCRAPHHEGLRPHPRVTASPLSLWGGANGSRECAPDDRLGAVSKDEATELENALIHAVLLEIRRHPFGGCADGGADSCLDSIRMRQDGSKPRACFRNWINEKLHQARRKLEIGSARLTRRKKGTRAAPFEVWCVIEQLKLRTTKRPGGKILQDGNIAAELPRTLLTFTRHFIGTCG